MSEPSIIHCREVSKQYGGKYAIQNLNLSIPKGRIVGVFGPNGSGKSTLFQLLTGLVPADGGEIEVLSGKPGWRTNSELAYLPDQADWFPEQALHQAIEWGSAFLPGFDPAEAVELARLMKVDESIPASGMSKGQKNRLMMVMCLARNVPLLMMDEPFSGIDLLSREQMINGLIDRISERQDQTVLISTHEILEMESLFDHVVFMDQGQVKLSGSADQLRSEHGSMESLYRKLYS